MGWRDVLRNLLESEEADETGEIEEIERGVSEAGDEGSGDEGSGDEGSGDEGSGDEGSGDEGSGDGEGDEGAGDGDEGAEGTRGDEDEGTAEEAELREIVRRQAAQIETLRNQVALLGGEIIEEDGDAETDAVEDIESEEYLAAFDADYAKRQANLAAITEGN